MTILSNMPQSDTAATAQPTALPLIPITKPLLGDEEANAAAHAIRTGWIAQGPLVAQFERAIAERLDVAHVVATSNCTTSLHLALLCSGIGPGDEVIVPSFTFIATANAVLYVGAHPVFVDIDPRTYNIDPNLIEQAITPRTKAIVPVAQIGLAADLDPILAIAERHGLKVVEDAAPALGATYRGRPVGAISPVTCFSFHPRKSITTGEGGAITTNDDAIAARARILRSHGASVSDLVRHNASAVIIESYDELGYNYRMTDIQGALGREQLKRLPGILERRRCLAERYRRLLARIPGLAPPAEPAWARSNWQSYGVRLPDGCDQRGIMQFLLDRDIASRRGIMSSHREPAYAREPWSCGSGGVACGCPGGSCERLRESERATDRCILLPLFPQMSEEDQDRVVDVLAEACERAGR